MSLLLREGIPEDARAAARLLVDVFPYLPVHARKVRSRIVAPLPDDHARHVAALADDRLVGWARSAVDVETPRPGHAWVVIAVAPEARGRGIGSALLADAEQHMAAAGAQVLHAAATDDDATRHFCARRGWRPTRWARYLSVDLAPLVDTPPPVPPAGILVIPARALDELYPLYDIHAECALDLPRAVSPDTFGFDHWVERIWRAPDHDPSAGTVALVDGYPVAFALFNADRPSGRMWSTITGVRRAYRGQGLGLMVKAVALHRAAQLGMRTAWTSGQVDQGPMARINERLGYQVTHSEVHLQRHLDAPPSSP